MSAPFSRPARTLVRVQREVFDAAAEAAALSEGRADIGALVSFVGLCRDAGGALMVRVEGSHHARVDEVRVAELT